MQMLWACYTSHIFTPSLVTCEEHKDLTYFEHVLGPMIMEDLKGVVWHGLVRSCATAQFKYCATAQAKSFSPGERMLEIKHISFLPTCL